jgi:hypothetical protein
VASTLTFGKLKRLHSEVSVLAKVAAIVAALAPASKLQPSQERVLDLFLKATDGEPDTVQEIGHAALAAVTPHPRSPDGTRRWWSDQAGFPRPFCTSPVSTPTPGSVCHDQEHGHDVGPRRCG